MLLCSDACQLLRPRPFSAQRAALVLLHLENVELRRDTETEGFHFFIYASIQSEFSKCSDALSATHSGPSATLPTSISACISLSLSLSRSPHFFALSFHPKWSKQMSALWSVDLLSVSFHRGVAPCLLRGAQLIFLCLCKAP